MLGKKGLSAFLPSDMDEMDGVCSPYETEHKCLHNFWLENLKSRCNFGDLGENMTAFKLILNKYGLKCWLDSPAWGYTSVADCYEHSDEPSGSIKGGKCLD